MGCQGDDTEKVSCIKDPICNDLYSYAHKDTICKDTRPIKVDWILVHKKKACSTGSGKHIGSVEIIQCARECRAISSMFIFGTNEFGYSDEYGKRCTGKVCDCYCDTKTPSDGYCPSMEGHEGYNLYKFVDIVSPAGCPAKCKGCGSGGSGDGGLPTNSNGICEHFCSKWNACGNGDLYKTGDDCRGCTASEYSDSDSLVNAKKKCDEDFRCHGVALNELHESLQLCYSRESYSHAGWRTIWREDVRKDCTWDTWTPWSDCISVCKDRSRSHFCLECKKTRTRNRHLAQNGGKPCDGEASQEKVCSEVETCNAYKYCYWDGTSPACRGDCPSDYWFEERSDCGDGHCCWTGHKEKCCQTKWH